MDVGALMGNPIFALGLGLLANKEEKNPWGAGFQTMLAMQAMHRDKQLKDLQLQQLRQEIKDKADARTQIQGILGERPNVDEFAPDTFPGETFPGGLLGTAQPGVDPSRASFGSGLLGGREPVSQDELAGKLLGIPGYEKLGLETLLREPKQPDIPSDIRSTLAFMQLTPDQKQAYMAMKGAGRASTTVNINTPEQSMKREDATNMVHPMTGQMPPPGMTYGQAFSQGYRWKPEALPQKAQDSLDQALDAFSALDKMEAGVGESGIMKGQMSAIQAALGRNDRAVEFQTGRANMKLAAQALIKGIPSNFDVQTVIDTLPDITLSEPVNKSRIRYSRGILTELVKRTIAYYKGTGYQIPDYVLAQARKAGVDIDSISPWSGQGDPLEGVATGSIADDRQAIIDELRRRGAVR